MHVLSHTMTKQYILRRTGGEDMKTEQHELLTTADLMEKLKVSRDMLYRLRKAGLPFIKIGGSIRYNFQDVGEWLEKQNE